MNELLYIIQIFNIDSAKFDCFEITALNCQFGVHKNRKWRLQTTILNALHFKFFYWKKNGITRLKFALQSFNVHN